MHSLESLRAIREFELLLASIGAPPLVCDTYGTADMRMQERAGLFAPRRMFAPIKGKVTGCAVYNLLTMELTSYDCSNCTNPEPCKRRA